MSEERFVAQKWRPRKTVPLVSLRALQVAAGKALFGSRFSRWGSDVASAAALNYVDALGDLGMVNEVELQERGDLTVVTGLPKWAYPRGGVCVGNVFLTGREPSDAVLRHERKHVSQWHLYGLAMPVLYWAAGRNPEKNWFEVEAGLTDGGYR